MDLETKGLSDVRPSAKLLFLFFWSITAVFFFSKPISLYFAILSLSLLIWGRLLGQILRFSVRFFVVPLLSAVLFAFLISKQSALTGGPHVSAFALVAKIVIIIVASTIFALSTSPRALAQDLVDCRVPPFQVSFITGLLVSLQSIAVTAERLSCSLYNRGLWKNSFWRNPRVFFHLLRPAFTFCFLCSEQRGDFLLLRYGGSPTSLPSDYDIRFPILKTVSFAVLGIIVPLIILLVERNY